jgi:hypothetical protein
MRRHLAHPASASISQERKFACSDADLCRPKISAMYTSGRSATTPHRHRRTSRSIGKSTDIEPRIRRVGRCLLAISILSLSVLVSSATQSLPAAADQVVPIVFPVAGPHSYVDDYGAPRSGGRLHQGIDIFTDKLTPVVAAEDGYISWWILDEGSAGYMLELRGTSGFAYWYIHLNNDTPGTDDGKGGIRWAFAVGIEPGAPVRKGQHIGYAGDSGNAEGTRPHLHFEIHLPDGTPINPYPSLLAAQHYREPDPSGGFSFHEYLTLQNPGDTTVTAMPHYLRQGAPPVIGDSVSIPPKARATVRVNDAIARTEHGTRISATGPIVAERPMYFAYGENLWTGGHVAVGLPEPRTEFYFAEGYTGPTFDQWLTLANPNDQSAAVRIDYLIEAESNRSQSITVPPNARATINVKAVVGHSKQLSTVVRSDLPIMAERPMYFAYGPGYWTGGHVSFGVDRPSTRFYFAEGYTSPEFDEWLTLGNPNEVTANVRLRFLKNVGAPVTYSVRVPPTTRKTLFVPSIIGRGYENSIELESDVPVLAERPMYFRTSAWQPRLGPVSGGTLGVGVESPATEWLFAEGYTGRYFQQYLTIGNPASASATVTVEYHGNGGLIKQSTYNIRAGSRFTIDVNAEIGDGKEVSVKVMSSRPIVVERPIYFRYAGIWTDGHTSTGTLRAETQWYFAEGYTG